MCVSVFVCVYVSVCVHVHRCMYMVARVFICDVCMCMCAHLCRIQRSTWVSFLRRAPTLVLRHCLPLWRHCWQCIVLARSYWAETCRQDHYSNSYDHHGNKSSEFKGQSGKTLENFLESTDPQLCFPTAPLCLLCLGWIWTETLMLVCYIWLHCNTVWRQFLSPWSRFGWIPSVCEQTMFNETWLKNPGFSG